MFGPPQPRLVSKSTYRSYTANPSADRFARSHPFSRAPPVFSSQVQPGATADANPHTLQRSPGGIDERDLPSVSVGAKYPPSMTMNSPSINSSVSYPVRNSPAAKLRTPPFGRGASADTNQSQSRMQRLRHAAPLSPAAAADETSRAVSSAMGELQVRTLVVLVLVLVLLVVLLVLMVLVLLVVVVLLLLLTPFSPCRRRCSSCRRRRRW